MSLSFNMDFILRDSLPSHKNISIGDVSTRKCVASEIRAIDDKEENMLPDSSLSPSNQTLLGYIMDEKIRTSNQAHSPSKECSTTTFASNTAKEVTDANIYEACAKDDPGSCQMSETFLFVSQLAFMELKLKDIEKELSSINDYAFSGFVNSASNLKKISGQTFLPHVIDTNLNRFILSDTEINERDDERRIKLRQIIMKHSEIKKWLSKIKKRLKDKKHVSKQHGPSYIWPTKELSHSSLPECKLQKGPVSRHMHSTSDNQHNHTSLTSLTQDFADAIDSSQSLKTRPSHLDSLRSLFFDRPGEQLSTGGKAALNLVTDTYPVNTSELVASSTSETVPTSMHIYEKNIFSTILSLSKDRIAPVEIPLLSYECDNNRGIQSNCDNPTMLADSDCLQSRNNPPTPDLRRAELDCNDISEGIRVLVVQKDYLRAGVIHLTRRENCDQKLWRVTLDGDRKCQDIIMSEWQLLEQGVREVIPTSTNQLCQGSRVCANWSPQLPMNLYPGTITRSLLDQYSRHNKLPIDFDDGDHKDVDLDQVCLLPENFPNLHELMKASNIADSNFYTLDRKSRVTVKRTVRLANNEGSGLCYKESDGDKVKRRRRLIHHVDRKKKVVVHWKLMRNIGIVDREYELRRNIDNLCIGRGDSVQLLSYSSSSYMACVVNVLARRQSCDMDIEFNWYYILADVQDHSEIIRRLKKSTISKKIIFKTSHSDINDVYSVLRKVEVLSFTEYKLKYMRYHRTGSVPNDDSYVIAGTYDQSKAKIQYLDDSIRQYIISGGL